MCGIGGVLRRDGEAIADEWLDAIDARIAYRGPDGSGRFRDSVVQPTENGSRTIEVALVHRRLIVIDPEGGHQPMVSEQGRDDSEGLVAVVFNGCIYNHRDLRKELEAAGHAFVSDHSDTEVIIHGYREWRDRLTDHLEGMYAFAVWDRANASMMLARDWFGEKPLYVRSGVDGHDKVVVFASDALAVAETSKRPNVQTSTGAGAGSRRWTQRYLQVGYNADGMTVYPGVGNMSPTICERIDALLPRRPRETHGQAEFEALIERAVQTRLESDVPLGCFLSGGVDSSLIAHFAKKHEPDVRTFSMRMMDERYDESHHAQHVADHLGTQHTTLDVAMNPVDDLKHLVRTLGQPFGDSSILPTYWISKAAQKEVTVALSGDGGDELFIGYDRYTVARHLNRHKRLLKWVPRRFFRAAHPKSRWHKLGRLGEMAREIKAVGIIAMESIFTQREMYELLDRRMEAPMNVRPGLDPMQSLRRFDLVNYLPNDLLAKVDTASMAVDLEVRAPFLDRAVVQAALGAPTHQLVPRGQRKGLLRDIARKYLPAEAVDRPKMGFAIPIGEWFRSDFGGMRGLLLEHLEADDAFGLVPMNRGVIRRLLDEHLSEVRDHGQQLFALLTLAMWDAQMRTG